MPQGIKYPRLISQTKEKLNISNTEILDYIERVISNYEPADNAWAGAISAQYFLLCLAKEQERDTLFLEELLNACLSSFRVTCNHGLVLDPGRILITPEETNKIIECMKEEDESDRFYSRSSKLRADNINSETMYLNFHYGLLVRILANGKDQIMQAILSSCLENLFEKNSLDSSGGWYPYRVPWITARILISLKYIEDALDEKQKSYSAYAIKTLVRRIKKDDNGFYFWKSGVGTWVSVLESTALCLEAIYEWGITDETAEKVRGVLGFCIKELNKDHKICLSDETSSNDTLSIVILASVALRVSGSHFNEYYDSIKELAYPIFANVMSIICESQPIRPKQYCTIPQILYYIYKAVC